MLTRQFRVRCYLHLWLYFFRSQKKWCVFFCANLVWVRKRKIWYYCLSRYNCKYKAFLYRDTKCPVEFLVDMFNSCDNWCIPSHILFSVCFAFKLGGECHCRLHVFLQVANFVRILTFGCLRVVSLDHICEFLFRIKDN